MSMGVDLSIGSYDISLPVSSCRQNVPTNDLAVWSPVRVTGQIYAPTICCQLWLRFKSGTWGDILDYDLATLNFKLLYVQMTSGTGSNGVT